MLFPENFEQKIGFDKIRELLKEHTLSHLGKEKVEKMAFSNQFQWIKNELDKTQEVYSLLHEEEDFSLGTFFDVREAIKRIRIEGTFLEVREAWDLVRTLVAIQNVVNYFHREEFPYPLLRDTSHGFILPVPLIKRMGTIFEEDGSIRDSASPELSKIRIDLTRISSSISRTLARVLHNAQEEGIVEKDTSPSMRDGRLVIPVAPMYKRKLNGIVHDSSSTGKTIFIEPAEIVEANNRLRELEGDERREIVRILTSLTDEVRPQSEEILKGLEFLAELDFLQAKVRFADRVGGIVPEIVNKPFIDWIGAMHPLLYLSHKKQEKKVVPLDIQLNKKQRILIISGPNAGGKSVCLKTLGLLQYMIQCGIPVPLQPRSKMGCFFTLMIDIGDEQSIENDLSTYSSHLWAMKQFVKLSSPHTLLLIDEFGAGTEPNIGGAIAEALLDEFNALGAMGVITTHYQNLKTYAEGHEGVVNGAMLYDRGQMIPLFTLSIGNAGSSFAIEIARKIGLPEKVILRASDIVGQEYVDMDKYLQDISRDKRYWENKRENIHKKEKELNTLEEEYHKQLKELSRLKREEKEKAKGEALQLLAESNKQIENTIRKIKESQAEKNITRTARKELEDYKKTLLAQQEQEEEERIQRKIDKLKNRKAKPKKTISTTPPPPKVEPLKVGELVHIKGQTSVGEILKITDKTAEVAFGQVKLTIQLDKLERGKGKNSLNEKGKSYITSSTLGSMHTKRVNFCQELDIRGYRAEEALQTIITFIDDAVEVGATKVKILHGTGTGVLREVTRNYLKNAFGVKDFYDEHVQFGGAGITIVELE